MSKYLFCQIDSTAVHSKEKRILYVCKSNATYASLALDGRAAYNCVCFKMCIDVNISIFHHFRSFTTQVMLMGPRT